MDLSHHCASCGHDLTRRAGEWVEAFRARVIRCPGCDRCAVRRSDPSQPWRRTTRGIFASSVMLASSILMLGFGSLVVAAACAAIAEPDTDAPSELLAVGPFQVNPRSVVAWMFTTGFVGMWLGAVHPSRPWRAAFTWLAVMIAATFVVTLVEALQGAIALRSGHGHASLEPTLVAIFTAVLVVSVVPVGTAAMVGAVLAERSRRRWSAARSAKARRRRDRRRATTAAMPGKAFR